MSPHDSPDDPSARLEAEHRRLTEERDRLQSALDTAYGQLSEVTSRVLAMSEASDSLVETHEEAGVGAALLRVAARSVGAKTGAVFVSQGEGAFRLISTIGMDDATGSALAVSLPDLALCQLAENEGRSFDVAEAEQTEAFPEWRAEAQAENPDADVVPRLQLFVPIALEERTLGVLALGPGPRGAHPPEDRLFLDHVATQGALSLDRAQLFQANEDRLNDLDALLRVSRELASTLDLDHVLVTAVNLTGAIVARERAVLALFEGGKLKIRAVNDFPRVDASTAERLGIERLLEYLGHRKPESLVVREAEVRADEQHEGRDVWMDYFTGDMRSAFAMLLKDDQGPVGLLLLESFDQHAFDRDADREAIAVLVGQLSVAIRNAELYRQLPMVSALTPLAERRRQWQRMAPASRTRLLVLAAVAVLALGVIPWPAAVGGHGQVLPGSERAVRSGVSGIVRAVYAASGEPVRAGEPIAVVEPRAIGPRLAELRAEVERARAAEATAGDRGDALGERLATIDRDQALARLAAVGAEDRRGRLTAPVDGVVLTPNLKEKVGSWLDAGETLCQVSPLDTMRVEIGVSETDVSRIRPGQTIRLKVLGYPDRQFKGQVTEIGWEGETPGPGKPSVFKVVGWVANPGPHLRSGMTGRARVDVGRDTILARATRGLWRALRMGFWT
jgi:multidrug efflux pump subunit AcrA (membrane-fusion protein)